MKRKRERKSGRESERQRMCKERNKKKNLGNTLS